MQKEAQLTMLPEAMAERMHLTEREWERQI